MAITLGTIVRTEKDASGVARIVQTTDVFQDASTPTMEGRFYFTAPGAIDADGANGQNLKQMAYMANDSGSDCLANAGMGIDAAGNVVFTQAWGPNCVICDANLQPKVFAGGLIASKTKYIYPGQLPNDPAAYVDAETVPYIVVPPLIISTTKGAVIGCKAIATWNGNSVPCVVADKGPANSIGELSIAAARALQFTNTSPRNGGVDTSTVSYELWPGQAAAGFVLQPEPKGS
jgi:hypothetical protein